MRNTAERVTGEMIDAGIVRLDGSVIGPLKVSSDRELVRVIYAEMFQLDPMLTDLFDILERAELEIILLGKLAPVNEPETEALVQRIRRFRMTHDERYSS